MYWHFTGQQPDGKPLDFNASQKRFHGNRKHGHKTGGVASPTYEAWRGLIQRCYNPRNKLYEYYGLRGITVCRSWQESFSVFLNDMGVCPPGRSIDRIDNDGPYCPFNCRWATRTQQAHNKRNNHLVTFNGETHCVAKWATIIGIARRTLANRLSHGWSPERALTEPARRHK